MSTVFVADDHEIVRQGLRVWLERFADLRWAGEASNAQELLARVHHEVWDAIILDLSFPGTNDGSLILALREAMPRVRICVYTMWPREQYEARCREQGADAYIEKSEPLAALASILRGEEAAGRKPPHQALSARESQVVSLLVKGLTPSEIANQMGVARTTISTQLHSIRTKLGVRSVPELLRYAFKNGLG